MANTGAGGSSVYGEEIHKIAIGNGIYTSELSSNIPDGFSPICYNLVATGDSLENRIGIRPSSVSWFMQSTPMPNLYLNKMNQLVYIGDAAHPILGWGSITGAQNQLNFMRADGTHDANDGFMQLNMPQAVLGMCNYNNNTYFSLGASGGINKISVFNWATDAITYASIASGATFTLTGLFSFKDRLWGWADSRLFFTDVAATGGLPEAWSSTNYVPFRSFLGSANIQNVLPLQNKLLVFTSAGLFTLLVQGAPASWILRILDLESSTSHPRCGFESKGIVYYTNTSGVWATNGTSVTKLSGVIEDQFFLSKGKRYQLLQPYEDGMILSIIKPTTNGAAIDSPNCRVYYSKLDPIAWTEWGIHPPVGETNNWGTNRLCGILSASKKLPTYLNADPTVYMLALISSSTEAVPASSTTQLLVFDGGENKGWNTAGTLTTDPLRIALKTKAMDGGNPYSDKMAKEGILELFTSDAQHMFSASWDIDATTGVGNSIPSRNNFNDYISGASSNLIRLPAGFKFRRCAFNFASSLQTANSQIKIKDLALRMNTERSEFEQVR